MSYTLTAIQLVVLVPFTIATVDVVRRILQRRIERKGYPLPPGPIAFPILGSALSIDARLPWLTYTGWRDKYGDIIYVRLLDTDVIVLNSAAMATELLEKRSQIYSDRPYIANVISYGHGCNFALSHYGEHWRLCRRIFQQTFNSSGARTFRPMQLRKARQLIYNIIDHPNECQAHFQTFAAATVMSAVYDYEPSPQNDPLISIADGYIEAAVPGLAPGKVLLLKIFPFLLHIPEWLPGSWIGREAKEARAWMDKVTEIPYQHVLKRMESNENMNAAMIPNHVIRMENLSGSHRSDYEIALKYTSTTSFFGSVGTTTSALLTFLLAMVKNPDTWRRAQAEIDAVVGTKRLPGFEDRPSLPYVDAILRETLRWRPVTPMLVPHAVTHSDVYMGYYIPKGATILANAWAMSRDEARYPDAEKFMPERFLDAEGRLTNDNPDEFVFGFGRRRCAGRHVADGSLWSAIATMLATLHFNLVKDANGNDITFEATFTSGITDQPNPFPYQLVPRPHVSKELLGNALAT